MATKHNSRQMMHQFHLNSITREENENPMFYSSQIVLFFSSLVALNSIILPLDALIPSNNDQCPSAVYDSRWLIATVSDFKVKIVQYLFAELCAMLLCEKLMHECEEWIFSIEGFQFR